MEHYKNLPTVRKIPWVEARKQLQTVNPELTKIIDCLDISDKKHHLYEANYPYGYKSVNKGKLYLPNTLGKSVPWDDHSISSELQNDLGYNLGSNPVSLVLKNTIEIYLELPNFTVIPLVLVPEGSLISTWLVLEPSYNYQPPFIWNISAGARSIFSLSKLSVVKKFNKVKTAFDLNIKMPSNFVEHYNLFWALANSPNFNSDWTTKILYFGKNWFQHLHDPKWKDFILYFYRNSWKGTAYWKNEFIWNLVFSLIQQRRNLKPDPFLADLVKHLVLMSLGQFPGFASTLDNSCAPIDKIKEVLTDVYQLDKYPPIIMSPAYFSLHHDCRPIYYFLTHQTVFDFAPKARKLATKRFDLGNVIYLLEEYLHEIKLGNLNLSPTPVSSIPDIVRYDFFHSNAALKQGIRPSSDIALEDLTFMKSAKHDVQFPASSPLLRGCIRISKKDNS